MKQNSSKGEYPRKTLYYAGAGLVIAAAVGMSLGLVLFENLALGCAFGAALGLAMGAALDARRGLSAGPLATGESPRRRL